MDSPAVFDSTARSTVNAAWAALTIEVLVRLGVETVITSPGSRSTPLTVAAVRNSKMEALTILDERSAGFFALGLAKRIRKPVVLVCTSGSALANYHPAVLEASMSGVPLLLLTADRPPELRACNSGQTIDQLKFFGDSVRAFYEMALPEVSVPMLAYLRQTVVQAVDRSFMVNPGPVHLNFPFRDPLSPDPTQESVISLEAMESAASVSTRGAESVVAPSSLDTVALERLSSHQRGMIVVGYINPKATDESFADSVAMLSSKLGWPVLADATNPLRGHSGESPNLVTHYDSLLRQESDREALAPTAVLQIGNVPTSKVLRAWLSEVEPATFLLTERPVNTDPLHQSGVVLHGSAQDLATQLSHLKVLDAWTARWAEKETAEAKRLNAALSALPSASIFEGQVAWMLSKALPTGYSVYLASSMSVRYAEFFWERSNRAYAMHCNRGANGIDGTLGTAMGLAHRGAPTVLLTGDLAFLHDSNALLAASQMQGSLTVVLINNAGGGIFEHLPIAEQTEVFENYFATPQSVDFAQLAQAHGVGYELVADLKALEAAVSIVSQSGLRILELRTDRKADTKTLKTLLNG